jgi:hypothetical protein
VWQALYGHSYCCEAHLLLGILRVYFQDFAHNAILIPRLISENIKQGVLEKTGDVLPFPGFSLPLLMGSGKVFEISNAHM